MAPGGAKASSVAIHIVAVNEAEIELGFRVQLQSAKWCEIVIVGARFSTGRWKNSIDRRTPAETALVTSTMIPVVAVYTKDVAEAKATNATDAGRRKGYPLCSRPSRRNRRFWRYTNGATEGERHVEQGGGNYGQRRRSILLPVFWSETIITSFQGITRDSHTPLKLTVTSMVSSVTIRLRY